MSAVRRPLLQRARRVAPAAGGTAGVVSTGVLAYADHPTAAVCSVVVTLVVTALDGRAARGLARVLPAFTRLVLARSAAKIARQASSKATTVKEATALIEALDRFDHKPRP